MFFVDYLKRWNKGISDGAPQRLAERLGINPGTVSRWISESKPPKEESRKRVADELGITVAELVASFAPRHKDLSGPEMDVAFAEVIGVVSAETFKEPSDDAVRLDVIDYVYKRKPGRRTYALRISGSCMEPKASDGDYAVIEETSDVPDGALAVICWDGECTLKRVYHRSDHLELRPDNPEYKILRPKLKDCQIIGIVKSFHRKP